MNGLEKVTTTQLFTHLWKTGNLDYKLHEAQLSYSHFVDNSRYIKNLLHAGRGWGKTWYFLAKCFEYAIRHPNSRIVYATQSRESVQQIVLPTYKIFTLEVPEAVRPCWKTQGHCFELPNGSVIVLEGADDDHGNKLRGAYAHLVIADELGFWRHADYVINSILLPQVQRVDGKIFMTSTSPESTGHEFYGFVKECKENNTYYLQTVYDNPRVTPEKVEEYIKQSGGRDAQGKFNTNFRREYLCEAVIDETRAVIPEFSDKIHVVDGYTRPDFFDGWVFMDLGLIDYTHVLLGYYDFEKATIVIEDEIVQNYKTTDDLAAKLKQKELELYPRRSIRRVADNELQQLTDLSITHGLHFAPAVKYNKEAALNNLRKKFQEEKIKILRKCTNLIHQLSIGIWNKMRTDYERLPGAGHLDGIDALIYGIRSIDYNHNPVPFNHGVSRQTHHDLRPPTEKNPLERLVTWYGKH